MWESNQRGFTLLEIIIAITLLAFITLGVVSITENAVITKERTTQINKNNLQIETALSRFEWDFLQIYSPLYFSKPFTLNQNIPVANSNPNQAEQPIGSILPNQNPIDQRMQSYYQQQAVRFERNENFSFVDETGIPIPRFYSPEKNVFEFFTTSNRRKNENVKQSHFAWVRYALAEQERTVDDDERKDVTLPANLKSLVRYFSADDPYSEQRMNPEDQGVKAAVLLQNVESLEFQFWNFERRKWETNLKSIPNGEAVLRGVKLIISWYDNNGSKRTMQRIFRNHWPMQLPQDLNQNVNGLNTNVQRNPNENTP